MAHRISRAITRAIADGAEEFARRRVAIKVSLEARAPLLTEDPVVEQAVYTIVRAMAGRLAPDSTVTIATQDRAGGDVELIMEVEEGDGLATPEPSPRGTYADLLELAISGLETFCRARSGRVEVGERALRGAPSVRRRYLFLIPTLAHDGSWHPRDREP